MTGFSSTELADSLADVHCQEAKYIVDTIVYRNFKKNNSYKIIKKKIKEETNKKKISKALKNTILKLLSTKKLNFI